MSLQNSIELLSGQRFGSILADVVIRVSQGFGQKRPISSAMRPLRDTRISQRPPRGRHPVQRRVGRNRANEPNILNRHQEAPSSAPEGQRENSPGQRSAATAALGNRPLTTTPSFHGPPRQPAGWRGGPWKEGIFITSLPRTSLRLSGATLMSSLSGTSDWLAGLANDCRFLGPGGLRIEGESPLFSGEQRWAV